MGQANSSLPALQTPEYPFKLWQYLLFRDYREPSVKPTPRLIVTTADASGMDIDRLTWEYAQPKAGRGVPADGFILWVNMGETNDQVTNGFKLSIEARAFEMVWPDGVARSYAISAYRNTYQGEQATDRVSDGTWINVT